MVTNINELNNYMVKFESKHRDDFVVEAASYTIVDYNNVQFTDEMGNNTNFYTCVSSVELV